MRAVDDEKRLIEGYAVVFNKRSHLLWDYNSYGIVEEEISPAAITMDMLRAQDIVACINHDQNQILARWRNGEGSLGLGIDEVGLKVRFSAPDTQWGHQAYEGAKRNDYYGMSFAYWNDDDKLNVSYTRETDGDKETIVRTVNKIDHICDVSIVTHPAYEDTSVKTRALEDIKSAIDEQFGKKAEERSAEMMSQYDELMRITRQ
jgi:hypothetical protein